MQRINDQRERRTHRLTIRSKQVQIGKVDHHPSEEYEELKEIFNADGRPTMLDGKLNDGNIRTIHQTQLYESEFFSFCLLSDFGHYCRGLFSRTIVVA
jgi:hypothetical protein